MRPRYAQAHHELGTAYYKQGMVQRAQQQYQKTLQIDPSYVSAYRNLALIHHTRGEIDQAMAAYAAVLGLEPQHVEAHLSLVRLYVGRGTEPHKALMHLRRVLALAPQHAQASSLKQLMNSLAARVQHGK